jgi:hypothetical protein
MFVTTWYFILCYIFTRARPLKIRPEKIWQWCTHTIVRQGHFDIMIPLNMHAVGLSRSRKRAWWNQPCCCCTCRGCKWRITRRCFSTTLQRYRFRQSLLPGLRLHDNKWNFLNGHRITSELSLGLVSYCLMTKCHIVFLDKLRVSWDSKQIFLIVRSFTAVFWRSHWKLSCTNQIQ